MAFGGIHSTHDSHGAGATLSIFFFVASKGGEYWVLTSEPWAWKWGRKAFRYFLWDGEEQRHQWKKDSALCLATHFAEHILPKVPLLQSNSDHPSGVREDSECRKALKIECDTSILPTADVFDVAWCRLKNMLNMWHISQSHNEHSTGVVLKSPFGTERPQLFRHSDSILRRVKFIRKFHSCLQKKSPKFIAFCCALLFRLHWNRVAEYVWSQVVCHSEWIPLRLTWIYLFI